MEGVGGPEGGGVEAVAAKGEVFEVVGDPRGVEALAQGEAAGGGGGEIQRAGLGEGGVCEERGEAVARAHLFGEIEFFGATPA